MISFENRIDRFRILVCERQLFLLTTNTPAPEDGITLSIEPALLPRKFHDCPAVSAFSLKEPQAVLLSDLLRTAARLPLTGTYGPYHLYASALSLCGSLLGLEGPVFLPRTSSLITPAFYALLHERAGEAWQLSELARASGVTREHLCREFRRVTGSTIGAYIRGLRLYRSALELLGTEKSVYDVLYDNGFSCPAAFYRAFDAYFGLAPAAYRRCYHNFIAQNLCL